MFYPPYTLCRKDKLSIIWLASYFDPDKHSKKISLRTCEKANIIDACEAIKNPKVRFALRLSAQLMLGTVRIYRIQTRMALKMAERIWLKLRTLISAVNANVIDMPVAIMRADAITISDTHMSIIDYSLEPVFYDPKMIMHMNESDFINVNSSPIRSPIKKMEKSTPNKTALIVSNSQISFQEDLLSPTRPIQIPPGDNDFGLLGFGPADNKFLEDLNMMDIGDSCIKPRALSFEVDDTQAPLETILESEEHMTERESCGKALEDRTELESDLARPIIDHIPSDKDIEQKKKNEDDVQLEEEISLPKETPVTEKVEGDKTSEILPLKRKAADAFCADEEFQSSNNVLGEPVNLDALLEEAVSLNQALLSVVEPVSRTAEETLSQSGASIDFLVAGGNETVLPATTDFDNKTDWGAHMQTPSEIVLEEVAVHVKKKLKIQIDKEIKIGERMMRRNLNTPETLIRFPIVAGSALPSSKEMFQCPTHDIKSEKVKYWWRCNLEHPNVENIHLDDGCDEDQDYLLGKELSLCEPVDVPGAPSNILVKEPDEQLRKDFGETPISVLKDSEMSERLGETPGSDIVFRAGSDTIKSFDQSAGSSITKSIAGNDSIAKSFDKTLNMDEEVLEGVAESPKISSISVILPEEPGFKEGDELDPIMEIDEESIDFTADNDFSRTLAERRIVNSLRTSETAVFQRLFPKSRMSRRNAALSFYLTLTMHKNGFIELQQSEIFGDIYMKKGRR